MQDLLFHNATVITMCDERPVLYDAFVAVKGGRIVAVDCEGELPEAKRRIDCHGGVLMPGLINTHAHTAMTIMRGYADDYELHNWLTQKVFPVEARLDERAVLAGARLGFAEMMRNGTTSVSDMYFFQPAVAQAALECGMRASLSNAIIALADDYDLQKDRAMLETYELVREWHGAGDDLIRADVAIHAEYTSPPSVWHSVVDIAKRHNLILHTHVSETSAEHKACIARYGISPTAVLAREGVFDVRTLAAHCVWADESDMCILAQRGVSVAHNPVSNLKLASGVADITALIQHGVNVSLGTDGCCSNNSLDMFEELKLAALLAKYKRSDASVIPAYEALKLATLNGARAQGREGQTGAIRAGYAADIVLLDAEVLSLCPMYDPVGAVVYGASGRDVRMTVINGRIVYDNGAFPTLDIDFVRAEAAGYAKNLVLSV
ncbi:MAG: amidohydrolase [Clostridia bacterium]|nr:amidohydrolase [Clostridia bacterium]